MSMPAVTREYTPGSRGNKRKPMRLPLRREMRPDYPALAAEQFSVPSQTRKESQFFEGTLESPPEHPHTSRRTLMAPQECEIAQCSPSQHEIMPDSPALAPEQFPVPHHRRQLA